MIIKTSQPVYIQFQKMFEFEINSVSVIMSRGEWETDEEFCSRKKYIKDHMGNGADMEEVVRQSRIYMSELKGCKFS